MNRIASKPFFATINFGLQIGYTDKVIDKTKVIEYLQKYQNQLIKQKKLYLSLAIAECEIVMSGQVEPHLKLSLINYPKFPLEQKVLKNEIETLTKYLMGEFDQNRIVIEYFNETVMFENSDEIDPRIIKK